MHSLFNISTGAFISLKTTSQVAEATYHIRICVCNIWFMDQYHSYKKFTLKPVQFQSSFCALMHQSNRICSWWPIALYQRISLLQTNIWRSFLRGQFVPFKAWHIMRYQILSQWTSVQITSASSAKCLYDKILNFFPFFFLWMILLSRYGNSDFIMFIYDVTDTSYSGSRLVDVWLRDGFYCPLY